MEDHVPRHAQMGAWVLINDRWYKPLTILAKRETHTSSKGILTLGFDVYNQRDELVQKGQNQLMVYR